MQIKKFLSGKGLDVSMESNLKGIENFYLEPDNFYTLKEKAEYESLDFIYSKNLINKTKFSKILLKEWFNFIKVGGKTIIEFADNDLLNYSELLDMISLIFSKKAKVIEKKKSQKSNLIVIEKLKFSLEKGDSINKWTFGIITDGSKEDTMNKQIDSILKLKIPYCEIIVCGNVTKLKKRKKVKYIFFHPGIPWITKQKNMICKNAKYENLVITHNRFNFDKNWYKGMKKFGNYFEVLVCKILDPLNRRAGDWLTYGRNIEDRWINEIGLLEYNDWDENGIINGSFHILKKSIWKKSPWDERKIWGMQEDDYLSLEFRKKGIVPRFNIHSTVYTFPERYGEWHWKYKFNPKKLGKIPFEISKKWVMRKTDRFFRKYFGIGFVIKSQGNTYGW